MEKCGFFAKRGKQRIEIFFKVFWMTGEREEILKKLTEVLKEGVSVATGQKTTIFMVCGGDVTFSYKILYQHQNNTFHMG